jgi:ketosteroid isomerase-like protein
VKGFKIAIAALVLCSTVTGFSVAATSADEGDLLKARELVWRAWFAGDTKTLAELLPPDTIAISTGSQHWDTQPEIIKSAAEFRTGGGKLLRLEFKDTKVQKFGDVAMLYSRYLYEIQVKSKRSVSFGRATEIFVFRNGKWLNPGWHTDNQR